MKTLISKPLIRHLNPQFLPQISVFRFPSLSRENSNFLTFSDRKWLCTPKSLSLCSATASSSLNYGGWDCPQLGADSVNSGESNQLHNFLHSLGIGDKKYIFMYLLGFVCALTVSRIRVWSIVIFPVCVVVFAVGFSIGFVKGGKLNELSSMVAKKRSKDENFRDSIEKLRNLVDMFNGFDVKVMKLKNDIKRSIDCNLITVSDLERYAKEMDSVGLFVLSAGNVVEDCIETILVENQEVERTSKQKSTKKRKEVDGTVTYMSQFVVDLFREKSAGSMPNKVKDFGESELTDMEVNGRRQGNILAPSNKERASNPMSNANIGNGSTGSGDIYSKADQRPDRTEVLLDRSRRMKEIAGNERMNLGVMDSSAERVLDNREYSYQSNRLRSINNQQFSRDMDHHNEVETWASHDDVLDSVDFSVSMKHMKSKASFSQEQMLRSTNGNFRESYNIEKNEKETYRSPMKEGVIADEPAQADRQSTYESDLGSIPSSGVSDDMEFNRYVMEANSFLKQARECWKHRGDEGQAENALQKSAKLLSRAIDLKPMSLLAVGQLGNTYLLHGELKLKISRELRSVLARSEPISVEKRRNVLSGLDDQVASKDNLASILVDVCEECEGLLVKAGRKYRLALSIDGNDMRALYNWGLALSFRAQLIADVGPEAALDADKVFLAAIDKFDAMMSKSNTYAPDETYGSQSGRSKYSHYPWEVFQKRNEYSALVKTHGRDSPNCGYIPDAIDESI
ncbi:unnamed protein product [Ilex paraguariensis]|uniref:Uncharacterized protein n=1 Tax=Ilex paraguariensis TaxID=185542 RepID=A0ABC8UB38_9AQUA